MPTDLIFPLKKIMVAYDGSDNALRAVQAANSLAKQNSSELVVVNIVFERPPDVYSPIGMNIPAPDFQDYLKQFENQGTKLVDEVVEKAKLEGIRARGMVLATVTSTVESIIDISEKENVDLIVVGTRGLGGFKKLLLGSVSSGIISHADRSVLLVR
jgi:nucleotide-binding universal stress UspA family protein